MKLHYAGKFDGNEEHLPQREHPEGSVKFKEPSMEGVAIIANIGGFITMIVLGICFFIYSREYIDINSKWIMLALISSFVAIIPHEFLHAICFKKDVYLYNNISQGLFFVIGTEDLSRTRFVFLSLFPNIVLGLIPYIIGFIFPKLVFFGIFGAICIGSGFGDYMNVYNALTQMPKNAKTYLNGFHSYWYIPKENDKI